MTSRILVAGLGSSLMADDGVGLEVISWLRLQELPQGLRLGEAGTDVLQLEALWEGEPHVWLVDALESGNAPKKTLGNAQGKTLGIAQGMTLGNAPGKTLGIAQGMTLGNAPGTLRILEHDAVMQLPQTHATAHHLSLSECLRWLHHAWPDMYDVRYRLWGIEPGRIVAEEGLTAPVAAAVPSVGRELLEAARARIEEVRFLDEVVEHLESS